MLVYQEKVNIPKEYLVSAGGTVFFILFFFGIGAGSLCSLVGFVYPAFKSLETLESKKRRGNVQWLVYWILYSIFSIIEVFVDYLLYIIPFYYAFKLAFLLWAMLPQTKGATLIYDSFLKDYVNKNESKIDAALNNAKKTLSKSTKDITTAIAEVSEERENPDKED